MELFSELMVSLLDQRLGIDVVYYQIHGSTIRCLNFVDTTTTFYGPISSLMDDNEDYHDRFACLASISIDLAKAYLKMIWLDSIVYNMDAIQKTLGYCGMQSVVPFYP